MLLKYYGLEQYDYYTVLFGVGRAFGILAQLLGPRAQAAARAPKSVTSDWLTKFFKDNPTASSERKRDRGGQGLLEVAKKYIRAAPRGRYAAAEGRSAERALAEGFVLDLSESSEWRPRPRGEESEGAASQKRLTPAKAPALAPAYLFFCAVLL